MTTVHGYDTRNPPTKIDHKDGANVLDGFTYALDKNGNLTDYSTDERIRGPVTNNSS